tara:strand:+ start:1174 stop:2109 length:936 start_codon:yes stop_codon:yes gene_type:complete
MTIKYLVLCGGGPVGLTIYGALKELHKENVWKLENIKTIYATSIGCLITLAVILDIEWAWLDDYIIKRPWLNLMNFTSSDYLNLMYSKGLLDEDFIIDIIKPLLLTKDIDIDVTLKEFYETTNVDLHLFTTNLNKFCKVDLNYKTHPDLKLYTAFMMSCCIPILIKPPYYNGEYYLDGGLFTNTPVNDCIGTEKCKKSEMLVFINDKRNPIDISNNYYIDHANSDISDNITDNSNLFSFVVFMLKTIFKKIMLVENENAIPVKNTINVCISPNSVDINYWSYVFGNKDERIRLIEIGKLQAIKFMKKYKSK